MKQLFLILITQFIVFSGYAQWTDNGSDLFTTDKVGIGVVAPNYELDVQGTINASKILVNGQSISGNENVSVIATFDSGTVADVSGNNISLTNNGSTSGTDRIGNATNARYLDGVDDYITVNGLPLTGDFSVNLWYDFSTKVSADLVGKYNGVTWDGWKLYFPSNGNTLRFLDRQQNGTSQLVDADVTSYTGWHMITLRVTGLTKAIFIDGAKVGENSVTTFHYGIQEPLNIGYNGTYYLTGAIDDIAIFDRAISDQEISNLLTGLDFLSQADWSGENNTLTTFSRVGLGVNSPNYDLDVNGTINASQILINGELVFGNDQILAHFSFDSETMEDISGNGNFIANSGSTSTSDRHGNTLDARSFDGIDDFMTVNGISLEGDFTVNLWHNFDSKISGDLVGTYIAPTHEGWKLYFPNNGNTIRFLDRSNHGNSQVLDFDISSVVGWHMVTVRLDGLTKAVFIDGVKLGENTVSSFNHGATQALKIGYVDNFYLDGEIDEISFFDRTLTDQEISDLLADSNPFLSNDSWIKGSSSITYSDGSVIIGSQTTTDTNYKLFVESGILTEKVKVLLAAQWPDYVFSDQYMLPTLNQVEKDINTNGHLTNIPSAQEVKEEGINLGEMDAKLLQKIEELTLYLIEQNKKVEALQNELGNLKKELRR